MFRHLLIAASLLAAVPTAMAQTYPNKQVRILVGFPPGGGADITARTVGQKLQEALGQPVVIENRPGAGGTIGAAALSKSPNDGYTLIMTTNGPNAIAPSLYATLPYDVTRDFAPISLITVTPYALVVHPSVDAASVPQLIAWLKSRPAPESYASAGNGTPAHLAAVLFASMAGVKLNHVPYKGAAPGLTAVLAGEVNMMFSELSVAAPHIKAGKIKALAVSGLARSPLMPDLVTVSEAGLKGFETTVWQSLMAPAGTPPEVIQRLNAEVRKLLALPDIKERFASLGATISPSSPEEMAAIVRRDHDKWAKLIKEAGIKAD
jgi:tripartite-type tricarboxylate transporter receptor subunit TctC